MYTMYEKLVELTVNVFISCGPEYLFLKRSSSKKTNPGKIIAVGGRVESGETFFDAAVREVFEETGYRILESSLHFAGVIEFGDGFTPQCIACQFKAEIADNRIPKGSTTDDGQLFWVHEKEILSGAWDVVQDLHFYFLHIMNDRPFFATIQKDDGNIQVVCNGTQIPQLEAQKSEPL